MTASAADARAQPDPASAAWWACGQPVLRTGYVFGLRTPSVELTFSSSVEAFAGRFGPLMDRLCAALRQPIRTDQRNNWLGFVSLIAGVHHRAGIAFPEVPRRFGVEAPSPSPSWSRVRFLLPTLCPQQTLALAGCLLDLFAAFDADAAQTELSDAQQERWRSCLRALQAEAPVGVNIGRLLRAAYRLGLPVRKITTVHYQFGIGRRARWLQSTQTDATPALGMAVARDKAMANRLLAAAGIPVPRQREVGSEAEALKAAAELGYPVALKPAALDGGVGARAGLDTPESVQRAYVAARQHAERILVEEHIHGQEYRLTVLNGRLLWAHERIPAAVVGDGAATLRDLVERENRQRAAVRDDADALRPIVVDEGMAEFLAEAGLTLETVPPAGQRVRLQRVPSVMGGGGGRAYTALIHPDNVWLAERAAQLLRLDIAGVDLLMPDLGRSWREVGGAVTEINAVPQISNLTAADLHERVLGELVDGDGRVPVLLVLSPSPSSPQWLPALLQRCADAGWTVGVSTPAGLGIGARDVRSPRSSVRADVDALALDPAIGAMIVLSDGAELLSAGLPLDRFDVLVLDEPGSGHSTAAEITLRRQLLGACREVFAAGAPSAAPATPSWNAPVEQFLMPASSDQQPELLFAALTRAERRHAQGARPEPEGGVLR